LDECDKTWDEEDQPTEYYGCRFIPVVNHATYRDGIRFKN
jgi:hypothetical protein